MMKRPQTRARIATFTLAVLLASLYTPAFAGGRQRPWTKPSARTVTVDREGRVVKVEEGLVNPLDNIGVEHNVYLACLMREGSDQSVSPLRRLVEECGYNPGTSTDEFVATYSSVVEADPYLTVAERMSPYKGSYSPYEFSFFERIDQALASATNEAEADALFAKLEEEAIQNLSTSTTAEQTIFAALSTARHSLKYWTQPGALPPDETAEKKLKWWVKVLVVVGADLAGAAGGLWIGGPVGAGAVGAGASNGTATVIKDA
jgi:hypothetical protein